MSLFFSYPDAFVLIVVTTLFGFFLSILGIPLVLKKQTFTGIALSQAAAFGGVLGVIIHVPRFVLPFLFILGTLSLIILRRAKRTADDGLVAILFIISASLGTLLISKMPTGEADLLIINFGNILALNRIEVWISVILSFVGTATYLMINSHLLAILNDIESAKALGYKPNLILGIYTILLASGITFGLMIFGVMVVFAYLIAPAFLAIRFSGTRLGWLAVIFVVTVISGFSGLLLSFSLDFPPGTFIAGLLGTTAFVSWIVKK